MNDNNNLNDDTNQTKPPEQTEQSPSEQTPPKQTEQISRDPLEPTIPRQPTVTESLITTLLLHGQQQDEMINNNTKETEECKDEEKDVDEDEKVIVCNHPGFLHNIGNLSKHDMSSYCKKGYRFYNVKCQRCKHKFVPTKPGPEEIKIGGKQPLYACMNEKEKCTIAYCHPCVGLYYEEERLKKIADELEKVQEN